MVEIIKGYHGPLSSYTEWHAFVIGLYEGVKDLVPDGMSDRSRENPDVEAEWHYACGGYFLGALFRIIVILIIGGWLL